MKVWTLVLMRLMGICSALFIIMIVFGITEMSKPLQLVILLWMAWIGFAGRPSDD